MRYRMIKTVLFFSSVVSVFAGLKNSIKFDGTTLKFYDGQHDSATFGTAVVSCFQKGGEVVMPKYKKLNDAVTQVVEKGKAWIGGGDFFGEGNYEWNDGERHEWTNWHGDEPSDTAHENCIEIYSAHGGTWNDRDCCINQGYVCQIPGTKSKPYEYSAFTVYDGYIDRRSHLQARQFCKRHKSRLALLHDDENLEALLSNLENPRKTPFWVDSEKKENSCISVSEDGVSDADCLQPMPFICEQVAANDLSVSEEQPFVEMGMDLNINCSASGTPVPKVSWHRDGRYVPHQKHGLGSSTLVLQDIGPDDLGMYVCKAVNEVGGQLRHMGGLSFVESSTILEQGENLIDYS